MTKHNMTKTTLRRTALRVLGTFLARPLERLLVLVHEWRTRRNIERSLGHLSNLHLRDVGLTKLTSKRPAPTASTDPPLTRSRVQRRTAWAIGE